MRVDLLKSFNLQALQKYMCGTLILVAGAFLSVMIFLFNTVRIGHVTGEEIGILLSKTSGKLTIIEPGAKIYNGITSDFYKLDKTLQILEMTKVKGSSDRKGKDDLMIKIVDGSDVYVDLKVQYKIDTSKASVVINTSGPGKSFKEKWSRDYISSLCLNYLGELTTEEFYDSSKRETKILKAKNEANKILNPFGIKIDSITITQKPSLYNDYDLIINKKKIFDHAILTEQSKALLAKQKQQTLIIEETNKKNVAIEQFRGEMEKKIIAAKAKAEKIMKEADAYYVKKTSGAEALLYQMTKSAEGIIAKKKAEAKGIRLTGETIYY